MHFTNSGFELRPIFASQNTLLLKSPGRLKSSLFIFTCSISGYFDIFERNWSIFILLKMQYTVRSLFVNMSVRSNLEYIELILSTNKSHKFPTRFCHKTLIFLGIVFFFQTSTFVCTFLTLLRTLFKAIQSKKSRRKEKRKQHSFCAFWYVLLHDVYLPICFIFLFFLLWFGHWHFGTFVLHFRLVYSLTLTNETEKEKRQLYDRRLDFFVMKWICLCFYFICIWTSCVNLPECTKVLLALSKKKQLFTFFFGNRPNC